MELIGGKLNKGWLPGCLLFFCLGCNAIVENKPTINIGEKEAAAAFITIHQEKKTVHSGDLIMRTGRDFTSDMMKNLSQNDKTYSHSGIASRENDTLFVYHAMGGEWNPDQKIRRDPFELFCNPYENRGFGIFRYHLSPKQMKNYVEAAKLFYLKGVTFDMQFDLQSNDKMYCTEYIMKSLHYGSGNLIHIDTTLFNHFSFIAPDNLFLTRACRAIKQIVFP